MAVESRKKKEADSYPAISESQTPVSSSSSGMDYTQSENTPKLDDAPQQVDSGTMDTMVNPEVDTMVEAVTEKANKQAVKGLFA